MKQFILTLIFILSLNLPTYAFSIKYYGSNGFTRYHNTLISCEDPHYLKIIKEALRDIERAGYFLPPMIIANKEEYQIEEKTIIVDDDKGFILGETGISDGNIYLNPYNYKYNLEEAYETIFHEIGHYNNFVNIRLNYTESQKFTKYILDKNNLPTADIPEIKRVLGNYACTDPAEFVAEYFAHKMMGDRFFSDRLTTLYHSFGGV